MSSIDTRVVEAKFDNSQFQRGVQGTLSSLDSLKRGLTMSGATSGLDNMGRSVDQVSNRFSVMRIAAVTAIATITRQLLFSSERFAAAFTIDPLKQGLSIYETKLNSIQTILANTGLKGKAGLAQVNAALAELNKYSNQTIYNFSEMAKNVGTFSAAGIKLDASVSAIKGIANLAAISGSNSQQASTAMYQLSQALASGTVKLMDWNSVVNAGMGGKVFQDALMQTAKVHGVAIDKMVKDEGGFRNTLQKGWLTSQILTETLNKFTGDLTKKQLAAQGYTDQQIKKIQELGKTATDAATKVKTIPQLMDVLKETVATGWAKSFETIIGNLSQAKNLFTQINNVVGGALGNMAKARNQVLGDWAKLGGRTALISGIKNAFQALGSVLKPIHDAFREIFPRKTGADLAAMTKSFRDFMANLKIGADTANNLKRTFAGVFAVLDIGWQVIKAGIKFIYDLFGAITKGEGSGGFLGATANIGDFLVALDNAIKKGQGLTKFFDDLMHILSGPIALLKSLAAALFGVFNFKAPSSDGITKSISPLTALGHAIVTIFSSVFAILGKVFHIFEPLAQGISKFAGSLGTSLTNGMAGINFDQVLRAVNTGLFGGLLLLFKKFIDKMKGGGDSPTMGLIDAIKAPFTELTTTLKSMQDTLRATTLLQIAAAVGILAASVVALSRIDAKGLSKALTAMAVMFGQLFAALLLFQRVGGAPGLILASSGLIVMGVAIRVLTSSVKALAQLSWGQLSKGLAGVAALIAEVVAATRGMIGETPLMIRAGVALILLGAAIRILVNSVTKLAGLSWNDMSKGLTGVATLLASLALYSKFTDTEGGGVLAGAGIILLATGIKILVEAITPLTKMSWGQIAKGIVGLAGAMLSIGIALSLMPPGSILSAAAILVVATSLGMITDALSKMGGQSWGQIAKSLVTLAVALGIIGVAISLIPASSIVSSTAVLIIASALGMITKALGTMGAQSWTEIAKGLVTLAASLGIIAVAMMAMTGALPGAAALLVVTAALFIFVPILEALGSMSWGDIVKGLAALAGVFVILAVAGMAMTPVVPTLLGLAAAVAILGVGIALVGLGVLAFATGLTALAASGAAASVALVAMVSTVIGMGPMIAKALFTSITALAEAIGKAAPAIVDALKKILLSLISAIHDIAPKLINTLGDVLIKLGEKIREVAPKLIRDWLDIFVKFLQALQKKEPDILRAMVHLLMGLLDSIDQHIQQFVTKGGDIIVHFIQGISKKLGDIIRAGTDLVIAFIKGIVAADLAIINAAMDAIVTFINGLATAIETHTPELRKAGEHLAFAIADGMTLGLVSKAKSVVGAAKSLASNMLGSVGHLLGVSSPSKEFYKLGRWCAIGLAQGLVGGKAEVKAAWQTTHDLLKTAIDSSASDIDKFKTKIKDLSKDEAKNADQIAKLTKKMNDATKENVAATKALGDLNSGFDKEQTHLEKLGKQYDEYTVKLGKANQKLKDATSVRDDYNKSVRDQYKTLPDIAVDTTLPGYTDSLKYQVADTAKFIDVLHKLRKKGLDDATYKLLLSKGTAALPFAEELLQGGQGSIDQINKLDSQLAKEAKDLGSTASTQLYQAGVDAAQGLVDGLKAKRKAIANEMSNIAKDIIKALKQELKIKSPSQVMHELGQFTGKGLANGIRESASVIGDAAASVGNGAVDAIKKSISGITEGFVMSTDLNPTITPVLDLSSIQRDAPKLNSLLSVDNITVDDAYLKAMYASQGYKDNQAAKQAADTPTPIPAPGDVTFIQNNSSPKALSPAEIYRQTKNQLSVAKGALTSDVA